MMNDEVGQQRLYAAEQRVSPAGEQQSVATRVEVAQEGQDEARSQAPAANSAREASAASGASNVKPRVEASQEDLTGVSSLMEDVFPSRKRGSEEMSPSDARNLTPADESMGISEMAVILHGTGELQSGRVVFVGTGSVKQPSACASSISSMWTLRQGGT